MEKSEVIPSPTVYEGLWGTPDPRLNSSCYVFRTNFWQYLLSSVLAECVCDESCGSDFQSTSAEGLLCVAQTNFCVHNENFARNLIRPKFLSLIDR